MHKVMVLGAAVVDVLIRSKDFKVVKGHNVPGGVALCEVWGGKIEGDSGVLETGGGGTNVSVGLRRLGEAVKLVSRVGDDEIADLIFRKMNLESVDISLMQKGSGKTGLSAVLVSSDGGRSIVTYRGESGEISGNEIDWSEVKKADWLQISSLGGQIDLLEDLVNYAFDNGVKIGINPGKGEIEQKKRLLKLLPKLDLFNVNRMEASMLQDVDYDDERGLVKSFSVIGPRLIAITDGKRGASLLHNNRWIKMGAFSDKSVDDTGAGDAFVAGVVCGILNYKNVEDVLRMGLANGGSVVTQLGAKSGLLSSTEMEKWQRKKIKTVEEWL